VARGWQGAGAVADAGMGGISRAGGPHGKLRGACRGGERRERDGARGAPHPVRHTTAPRGGRGSPGAGRGPGTWPSGQDQGSSTAPAASTWC